MKVDRVYNNKKINVHTTGNILWFNNINEYEYSYYKSLFDLIYDESQSGYLAHKKDYVVNLAFYIDHDDPYFLYFENCWVKVLEYDRVSIVFDDYKFIRKKNKTFSVLMTKNRKEKIKTFLNKNN